MTTPAADAPAQALEPVAVRSRRSRVADVACVSGLVFGWLEPVALAGATPFLLAHHDTVLEALTSSAVSIVTGGALARVGRASLVLVILAPLCGIALADVFLWWAGRRWGDRIVSWLRRRNPRSGRWVERADRWVLRHGPLAPAAAYFLPVPNALLYLSCGTAGMSLLTFAIGDAIGTLLWTGLLVGIGWSAGRHGVRIVDGIQHYEVLTLVVIVIGAVLLQLLRRRAHR
jgi:membrane-associated protein